MSPHTLRTLGHCFNCSSFHPKRSNVISTVLAKHSILNIVPANTNGSVYCRVPTTVLPNITVIVSPLVSLVHSRISTLGSINLPTTFVGAARAPSRRSLIFTRTLSNRVGLLCTTPRHLRARQFHGFTIHIPVSLITISRTRYISR